MPEHSFEFKQFKIWQSGAAFKVGTDACILGAWIKLPSEGALIDIGTGSGVIALMAAQRSFDLSITGVEIDDESAEQARLNFVQSPWSDRLELIHQDILKFTKNTERRYDVVVCNPPFFKSSTPAKDGRVHIARHESHLDLGTLLLAAFNISTKNGRLNLVMPFDRLAELRTKAERQGWHVSRIALIRPNQKKAANRIMVELTKTPCSEELEELVLYNPQGQYSAAVYNMLQPFYLKL